MQILQAVPLALHSTMRLGGKAAYAVDIHNREELTEAIDWAVGRRLPIIMIGSGSNIIWKDEGFNGLLLVDKIMGYQPFTEDDENYYITIGSGEIWDSVVQRAVEAGTSGIECLSLIPGTAGATPIQNVGAYGQEISQTLVSLEAYDTKLRQFVTIPEQDCAFSYRSSRFKTNDRGRFLITGLTLHLIRNRPEPPFYPSLQFYLDQRGITEFSPAIIREAVIAIRRGRLPDPIQVANNGSFFANPLVEQGQVAQLSADHPGIVYWTQDDGSAKLSAAWLVEQAGFKNAHDVETGMATWPYQPLVFINERAKSTADLLNFKQKVVAAVQQKFNVTLQQEPELLP